MTNVSLVPFTAEHRAANRADGPVGREIARLLQDVEGLAAEYIDRGVIDGNALDWIRSGADRVDMHSKVLALADDLQERAQMIRRQSEELSNSQDPRALARSRRMLNRQIDETRDLLDNEQTDNA